MKKDSKKLYKPERSPYKGQLLTILFLILPPILLCAVFYSAFQLFQGRFGADYNWNSAKMFGCGISVLFHCMCWMTGAFKRDFRIVKARIKEFFADLLILPKLAFKGYWEDVKLNGIAFWIDFAIIALNLGIFIDALLTFLSNR